jgi:hypothetical protein
MVALDIDAKGEDLIHTINTRDTSTIGLRVEDPLTQTDIRKAVVSLDMALERNDTVSVYLDCRGLQSMTPQDFLQQVAEQLNHSDEIDKFDRVAIVAHSKWLSRGAKLEDVLSPDVDVQAFKPDQANYARRWSANTLQNNAVRPN